MESYISSRELAQMNVLTKTWLSETAFITDEIRFLRKLINHQTLFLPNENYLSMLMEIGKELSAIEKEVAEIKENIKNQFHQIYYIMTDKKFHPVSVINNHRILEEQMAGLTKRYRMMKNTVLKNAAKLLEQAEENE